MQTPPGRGLHLLGRMGIFLGCAVGMGFAASGGCTAGQSTDSAESHEPSDSPVREAKQAITSAQACLSIVRSGATGTVFDTQIANKVPAKNYGTSQTMNTGPISGEERQSLLQFDLSAIPSGPNTNVTNASITLAQGTLTTGPGTIEVHNVLAPWSESTVTWQSFAGAYDPTVITTFSNANSFVNFNIYQLVDDWVHGVVPNNGILLKDPGTNLTNFWSSEYLNFFSRPQLYVCWTVTCDPGFADCNVNGFDGCEIDTTTNVSNCGGCGQACSIPNATPACVASSCAVGSCNLGWGDCDGLAPNGCETMLTTNTDCGACGVPCALSNASASCATGTCTLTACNAGHFDCDGDPSNGCEPLPCANGQHCATGSDCSSFVCIGGFCAAPTCLDAVKNGNETDIDCGGGACPPCNTGNTCSGASDCLSSVCTGGVCQAPTCTDGVQNGAETDVDCGGGTCATCAIGQGCSVNYDCATGICVGGFCQPPSCNDGVKNGGETGVDCGGSCAPCSVGVGCAIGADCTSGSCVGGVCQIPNCNDGVQNGSETGVDCGGFCAPCFLFQPCAQASDCQPGDSCVNGYCQAPTCSNGVRDGNETGVDCGGSCFRPETCNNSDDDCNGSSDEGLGTIICGLGACQQVVAACNAGNPGVCTPGAPQAEICGDGIDNNCDGVIDEGCPCTNGATQSCYSGSAATAGIGACHSGTQTCMHGQWGACVGEATPTAESCDSSDNDCNGATDDGLGTTSCGIGGCLSTVPRCLNGVVQTCVPKAASAETCDNVDNDCNGLIDDGLAPITCGVGACQVTVPACVNGLTNVCTPKPPTPEVCDGIDNDCNGVVDNGVLTTYYRDADGDGYGNPAQSVQACSQPAGYVLNNTDCNDSAAAAHPGGTEVCDGLDNNCNGSVDEGLGSTTCGVGACTRTVNNCVGGVPQTCVPGNPTAEICDGIDNNCNGSVDELLGSTTCGVGQCTRTVQNCVAGVPQACVPGAPSPEVCDGLDNDCNGVVDNGVLINWFRDADGDGFGTTSSVVQACTQPAGYVSNNLDCNDNNSAVRPSATEVCNGIDDNCNGAADETFPGKGSACSTGQTGVCAAGTLQCGGAAGPTCVRTVNPSNDTCDGANNDCDPSNTVDNDLDDGFANSCGAAAVTSVPQSASVTLSGKTTSGASDYIVLRFDGAQGTGGWFYPRVTLTNTAGGQYNMHILTPSCAGSIGCNVEGGSSTSRTSWSMDFPADPNGCVGAFGGFSCSDANARPTEVVVQVNRISGSAPNQYYTLTASNCNGACSANYATSTNGYPAGDGFSNVCGSAAIQDVLPGQSFDLSGHLPSAGGNDFFQVQFQGVGGTGTYFHPKVDMIDSAGGQYRMHVLSGTCGGGLPCNLDGGNSTNRTTWEALYPNDPNACSGGWGGFTCTDADPRPTLVTVQVFRTAASSAACANYRIRISNQ